MVVVVLFKIWLEYVVKVFGVFLEDFVIECILCMLMMDFVQKEILEKIEGMFRNEFMLNFVCINKCDLYEVMVEIFNNFDW